MSQKSKSNGRWVLIGLAVLFAGPLVLAWVLYFTDVWRPADQVQHGVLMDPPRSLVELSEQLTDEHGKPINQLLKGKWSVIQVATTACIDACLTLNKRLRQVRLALSHRRDRVQRVFMYTDDVPSFAATDTQLLMIHTAANDPLMSVLGESALDSLEDSVFVSDPMGNLIMVYSADVEQKALLEDLKRLLRLSQIG